MIPFLVLAGLLNLAVAARKVLGPEDYAAWSAPVWLLVVIGATCLVVAVGAA